MNVMQAIIIMLLMIIPTMMLNGTKHSSNNSATHNNTDNGVSDTSKNNNIDKWKSNFSSQQLKGTVYITGDSMVKKVNVFLITKNVRHKFLLKVRSFGSAKFIRSSKAHHTRF